MKKIGALLLTLTLLMGLFPQTAAAAEATAAGPDLTAYLDEISTVRGLEVSEENIEQSLSMYGLTKEDFKSADEIKAYLGEAIHSDLSNLDDIYSKYGLDQTSLSQLLNEYGEDLKDYIFLNDLDFALTFYTYSDDVQQEADFDAKLDVYLTEVSAERGFTVTRDDISSYLSEYSSGFDDFETVSDLKDYLGEVIKADLSNLDYFKTNYGMDEKALLDLVEKNGGTMEDYIYMDQLEELIWASEDDGSDQGDNLGDYMDILNQLGITETEVQNLENHFLSNADYLSSPEVQSHMEDLVRRMMVLAETFIEKGTANENYRPSDAEISEFASIYEDLLSTAKLKVVFNSVKDGVETKYSIEELMNMDAIENADFKVAIYNDNSELLADAVITSDFIKSNLGKAIEDAENATGSASGSTPVQTVKGGALPKTAGNYINKAILGLFFIIAGILIFRKIRTEKNETAEK